MKYPSRNRFAFLIMLTAALITNVCIKDLAKAQPFNKSSSVIILWDMQWGWGTTSCCGEIEPEYSAPLSVHVNVHSLVDENGCMRYSFHHNVASNFLTHQANGAEVYRGTERVAVRGVEIVVCDPEQCEIEFTVQGSLLLQPTKESSCQRSMIIHYSGSVIWNRCTDEWRTNGRLDVKSMICVTPKKSGEYGNVPLSIDLIQNYPNPFSSETMISFSLTNEANVHLTVLDLFGREVALVANERYGTGTHRVSWSGLKLLPGTYILRLSAVGHDWRVSKHKKLMVRHEQ